MELSNTEKDRYARQLVLANVGLVGQVKLKASTVYVIGAGGLGSSLLLYLAAAGIGKLVIVDGDHVSLNNLQRQVLFKHNQLNDCKSVAAKENIQALNNFVAIETYSEYLSESNIKNIIPPGSLIADCSDNFKTRFLISDYAVANNCVHVSSAVYKHQIQFGVFNFPINNQQRSATLHCAFPQKNMEELQDSCAQIGVIGVVPGMGGMLIANELIKIITDSAEIHHSKIIVFDTHTLSIKHWQIKRTNGL